MLKNAEKEIQSRLRRRQKQTKIDQAARRTNLIIPKQAEGKTPSCPRRQTQLPNDTRVNTRHYSRRRSQHTDKVNQDTVKQPKNGHQDDFTRRDSTQPTYYYSTHIPKRQDVPNRASSFVDIRNGFYFPTRILPNTVKDDE